MKKQIVKHANTKYKKQHKGILTPIEWKPTATTVSIGLYGIQILKSMRLHMKLIETIRRISVKNLNKSEKLLFRMITDIPVSKKPKEIRMGKGKGDVEFFALRAKAGQSLIEFITLDSKKIQEIFKQVKRKLPVPSAFIINQKRLNEK